VSVLRLANNRACVHPAASSPLLGKKTLLIFLPHPLENRRSGPPSQLHPPPPHLRCGPGLQGACYCAVGYDVSYCTHRTTVHTSAGWAYCCAPRALWRWRYGVSSLHHRAVEVARRRRSRQKNSNVSALVHGPYKRHCIEYFSHFVPVCASMSFLCSLANTVRNSSHRVRRASSAGPPSASSATTRSIAWRCSSRRRLKLSSNLSTASLQGCIVISATVSLVSFALSRRLFATSSPMHWRICFSVSKPALRMASHELTKIRSSHCPSVFTIQSHYIEYF
jgi:hypothetical protein